MSKYKRNNRLFESQESKSIDEAKKLVMRELGYTRENADKYVRNYVRSKCPASRNVAAKFILGLTRLIISHELDSERDCVDFNKTLEIIASTHINEYDRNLNNESADTLIDRFSEMIDTMPDKDEEEITNMNISGKSRYKIYKVDTFEKAREFSKYTTWCVTESPEAYERYTAGESGLFYIFVRDDFKEVEKTPGEDTPLDDYGLSMIATCVNYDGSCNTITCRWNHFNGGNDSVMTPEELSKIVNMNYYKVCLPFTDKELEEKGIVTPTSAAKRLQSGESPKDIFTPYIPVNDETGFGVLNGKYTIVYKNRIRTERKYWFSNVSPFSDGWARATKNRKFTYVNMQGELFGKMFYDALMFENGCAAVRDEKDTPFYVIDSEKNNLYSGERWYKAIKNELTVYQKVPGAENWRYIMLRGKEGREILSFMDENYNVFNGGLLWFDQVGNSRNGFIKVEKDEKSSFVRLKDMKLIGNGKMWFDSVSRFTNGICKVEINNKYTYINDEGRFVTDKRFSDCTNFYNDWAGVCVNGKWILMNKNGEFKKDHIFDNIKWAKENMFAAQLGNKYTYINGNGDVFKNGKIMFDKVGAFNPSGYAVAELNGDAYIIYTDFKIVKKGEMIDERMKLIRSQKIRVIYS